MVILLFNEQIWRKHVNPVASLGVSWMRFFCSAVYVNVCVISQCTALWFFLFFPFFVSFTVCKPFVGSALVRLEESGFCDCLVLVEGKSCPKQRLSFGQTRFRPRAPLKIIGCHPDAPACASKEISSFRGILGWRLLPQGTELTSVYLHCRSSIREHA